MERIVAQDLTVGVEIEALTAPGFGPLSGHPSVTAGFADALATKLGWWRDELTISRDPESPRWTLHPEPLVGTPGQSSFELPSPVLRLHNLSELTSVCRALVSMGCDTNASCGLHVHVGGLSPAAVVSLLYFVYEWEECLYAAVGGARRLSPECRPLTHYFLARFADLAASLVHDPESAQVGLLDILERVLEVSADDVSATQDKYTMPRRTGLNLCALKLHNTVEFRYAPGSIDAETVIAVAHLMVHTAAAASAHPPTFRPRRPATDLSRFLRAIGLPPHHSAVLLPTTRKRALAAEARRRRTAHRSEVEALNLAAQRPPRGPIGQTLRGLLDERSLSIATNCTFAPLIAVDGDEGY